jgi:hypothetical protein
MRPKSVNVAFVAPIHKFRQTYFCQYEEYKSGIECFLIHTDLFSDISAT